jgi:hypothetical protein
MTVLGGGVYLFLLGFSSGIVLLTLTAYRRVSPPWLRWLLGAVGLFMLGRYVTMALFAAAERPEPLWALRHFWFATSFGLPLSSAFALDQLIRHPAMTPKKLLVRLAPLLLAYAAVILFGRMSPAPDRIIGWTLHLSPGWQRLLSATHGLFVAGFLGICALLTRKLPAGATRTAVLALAAGQALLAVDGLIVASGGWYVRPYLYSELFMLAALWFAFETAGAQAG